MKIFFFLILIFIPFSILPQNNTKDLSAAQKELRLIKSEINELEKKLDDMGKNLNWQIKSSENLEKQVTLVQKSMRLLKKEINHKNLNISSLNSHLDTLQNQIGALQEIFRKQILFAYKYQRGKELLWVLGSNSVNQAFIRYRAFRKISEQASFYFEILKDKQREKLLLQRQLQNEVLEKQNLAKEKEKDQILFSTKHKRREKLITEIKNDTKLLSTSLTQKKKNYDKLLNLISSLEAQKDNRQLEPQTQIRWEQLSGDFKKYKGKLNWPVTGKVIHPFGKYKNPQLKTVLNNTGIDIKSKEGTEVRCVFPGVVSLITYMSGFGNTIIVDHNNSYYTVYTHLNDVLVNKFQFLETGQVIGLVGDSGSLEGEMLHFEIYGGNKPLNPITWLKK